MNSLVVNFLLYLIYTISSIKRGNVFTIHNLIAMWFTFVAFMGVLTVYLGIYGQVFGYDAKFPLEPYLYAFVGFLIFIFPFRKLNGDISLQGFPITPSNNIKKFIRVVMFVFVLYFLVQLNVAIYTMSFEGSEAYDSIHETGSTLYSYNNLESKIVWVGGIVYQLFSPVVLYYYFNLIINSRRADNNKYLFIIFFVLSIIFLNNIAMGARGGLFFFVLTCLFIIMPLYEKIPLKTKRVFKLTSSTILAISLLYTVSVTISRFDSSATETPIESIFRYLGEPFPNLGHLFWEKVYTHPLGARLYPFFVTDYLKMTDGRSLGELHDVWQWITGVPILNFKTIWGDFYVEFGTFIAMVIMIVYSGILYAYLRKNVITIEICPLLFYYLNMASNAPMYFSMRGTYNFTILIYCIISYYVLRKINK